jgi:hypothetical protein
MAMDPQGLKAKIKATVYNGLKKEFGPAVQKGSGYSAAAEENWNKMAEAISGLAADIVTEITTNAMVLPGQAVVGIAAVTAPGAPAPLVGCATASPGTIM